MGPQSLDGGVRDLAVDASGGQLGGDRHRAQRAGAPARVTLGEPAIAKPAVRHEPLLGAVDLHVWISPPAQLPTQLGHRVIAPDDHPQPCVES